MRILDVNVNTDEIVQKAMQREQQANQSVMETERRVNQLQARVEQFSEGNSKGRAVFLQTMAKAQSFRRAGLLTEDGLTISSRTGSDRIRFINERIDQNDPNWRQCNMIELYELPWNPEHEDLIYLQSKDLIFRHFREFLLDCDENGNLLPRNHVSGYESDVCTLYDFDNHAYVVKDISEIIKKPFLCNGHILSDPYEYAYVPIVSVDEDHRLSMEE